VPVRQGGYGRHAGFRPTGNERPPILNIDDPRYSKALRHPLRVRILATLQECEATPTQLAQWLGASVGTAAYHVRALASLGLIELVGETRVRGAVAHHYRALPESDLSEQQLSRALSTTHAVPGATLSPLDPQVCPVAAVGNFDDERSLATRATLRLDAAGWHQLSQACEQLLKQADQIARSSAQRLAQNPAESDRDAGMVLFMFESRADASAEGADHGDAISGNSEAVS